MCLAFCWPDWKGAVVKGKTENGRKRGGGYNRHLGNSAVFYCLTIPSKVWLRCCNPCSAKCSPDKTVRLYVCLCMWVYECINHWEHGVGWGGGAWANLYSQSYSAYLKLYDTFIYYIPLYVYFQEYPNKGLTDVQTLLFWWSVLEFVETYCLIDNNNKKNPTKPCLCVLWWHMTLTDCVC